MVTNTAWHDTAAEIFKKQQLVPYVGQNESFPGKTKSTTAAPTQGLAFQMMTESFGFFSGS